MNWNKRYDNINPGTWRGVKSRVKGRIQPRNYMGNWGWTTYNRVANSPFIPFKSKPIKRRDKRSPSKPR